MSGRLKVLIGIGVVVLAGVVYQVFGTATIAITSDPSGAVVRVDGRQRGLTPLDRLELDSGSHRIEILHSHFKPHEESVRLSRGDHVRRHIRFTAGEGRLKLLSNPRGAWIEVNGERLADVTPTELAIVSGEHVIAMGQAERHIVEERHVLKHNQTLEVNFDLNIDPHGSVTITTSPRNARVEFMGEDVLYTPNMRLRIGEYAVRVSSPGYVTQEFRHDIRYGNNLHHVELERDFGALRVVVNPKDAEVRVSYRDGGGEQHRSHLGGSLQIPVGRVEVRARAFGFRTAFRTINLTRDGAAVRFDLQPMAIEVGKEFNDTLSGTAHEGPPMIVIPAGSFMMGDADGPPSERPLHQVTLTQPFAVSKFEITIGDFLPFLEANARTLSARLNPANTNHALSYVSYADAVAYTRWLSARTGEKYRLLSEAEWEYVARAGSTSHYFWGDDELELCRYANIADRSTRNVYRSWDTLDCDDGLVRPGPVGTYEPNPFGLHDVYGNVAEWVADCGMPEYAKAPEDGSAATEGYGCTSYGVRGGSWDSLPVEARSSYRNTGSSPNDDRGFRVVREL